MLVHSRMRYWPPYEGNLLSARFTRRVAGHDELLKGLPSLDPDLWEGMYLALPAGSTRCLHGKQYKDSTPLLV